MAIRRGVDNFFKTHFDSNFDNSVFVYDTKRCNFLGWLLGKLKTYGVDINFADELADIHNVIKSDEITKLQNHIISETDDKEFKTMINHLIEDITKNKSIGDKEIMVQRYVNFRIVIPNQDQSSQLLPWHSDMLLGSGTGMRTIWMPMTKCFGENSLQVLTYEDSVKITEDVYSHDHSYETFTKLCEEKCTPLNMKPGEANLFTELHMHGNVPNTTDKTRVSFDFRILFHGEQFYKKIPGGYFRLMEDIDPLPHQVDPNKSFISYCENNSHLTKNIPIFLQRLLIKEYCKKYKINIKYQQVELNGLFGDPILKGIRRYRCFAPTGGSK